MMDVTMTAAPRYDKRQLSISLPLFGGRSSSSSGNNDSSSSASSSSSSSSPSTTSRSSTSSSSSSTTSSSSSSTTSSSTTTSSSSSSSTTSSSSTSTTPTSTSTSTTPTSTRPSTTPTPTSSRTPDPTSSTSTTTVVSNIPGNSSTITVPGSQDGRLNGGDSGNSKGFFDDAGAVGGTFAAVGIVAALIIAGLVWLFYRRRKAQRMDADVAMAASAAAATTRTPFDDDDPEMIEHNYGQVPDGSASNFYHASQGEYEPSQFSGAGYAGAAGAAGAAGYGAAAYHDYYNGGAGGNSQGHYYDNPQQEYMSGGAQSQGHAGAYSQGHYYDEYGQPLQGNPYGGYEQGTWDAQQAQPMNPEGMPFTSGAMAGGMTAAAAGAGAEDASADHRRSSGMPNPHANGVEDSLLGPDVFADQPSPQEHAVASGGSPPHASDDRLNLGGIQRSGSRASNTSLRDDQDYTRRVLSLANN